MNEKKEILWELINPSDPYTFRAPTVEIAGTAACLLSGRYGAKSIGEDPEQRSPVMFGWREWMGERNIDDDWVVNHGEEIADALESMLIGSAAARVDAEAAASDMTKSRFEAWRAERQERLCTSMNNIGTAAYELAKRLREIAAKKGETT